ncbi:tRNA uridine-5-carboxymethylaminomethyl(34) synthesis GTPase MnmE [Sphingobium sp. AN558]|uniref:tRNA uridine-5-carboxymethylaminomethyl(34) synthesis GTPase MnmE n=1 Tax=Sphingobium sp. AN558 TaxID=3133442 RepID=UPI0030BAE2BE
MADSIFALSSGAPPAAIAIIRISGPAAGAALGALAGDLPPPRRASVRLLIDPRNGEPLDRALLLWFPGPDTATGEDLAELHCHGGRAVIAALESALGRISGLRRAEAGEFTRRAFANGRMDLNIVEGLSDLLTAETEQQRRSAMMMAEGHFSQRIEQWRRELLKLAAMAEAALDFSDEDDVPDADIEMQIGGAVSALAAEVGRQLEAPSAERLRDGIRVVLAGPPNAGKSTLLNALVGRDAAIVSDIAGTTRDRIEVPAALGGTAFLFTDTAGLRDQTDDAIEAIGIDRARAALDGADVIIWLGAPEEAPDDHRTILVAAQCDRIDHEEFHPGIRVAAPTGQGMDVLVQTIQDRANAILPGPSDYALHDRQRRGVAGLHEHLIGVNRERDMLIIAEELRLARKVIDVLTGRAGTEDMLDQLFSGFCIGK